MARPGQGTGRLLIAVVAGLATFAAFPPLALPIGALVGPAVLAGLLRSGSGRSGFAVGLAYGLAFQLPLLQWLSPSIAPSAWIALAVLQALWVGLLGWVVRATAWLPLAPARFAVLWLGTETVRSAWPFGGMPWGRLGFAAVDTPWQPLLAYVGVSGVSLLAALTAALAASTVAALLRRESRPRAVRPGVVLGCLVVVSLLPLAFPWPTPATGTATVALVQGGVPGSGRRLVDHHREVTENHVNATIGIARQVAAGSLPRPDLVVWPENSTAVDPLRDLVARDGIERAVAEIDAPVLVGGMVDGPTSATLLNQGVLWTPEGPTDQRYTKRHPVPFGEYIPFRNILGSISPRLDEVPRDVLAGTPGPPLQVGDIPVADAICFDVAYDEVLGPQVAQGAELAVVQTSNASFTGTVQVEQQLAITRARAAVIGRAVAVASTNGVTAMVGPDGDLLRRAPLLTTQVLVDDLPLVRTTTPAVRLGEWPAWIAALLSGAAVVLLAGRRLLGQGRLRASRSRLSPASRSRAR